ncbi:hypothetical protein M9H77_28994 [Catharanthus roseus]|uniref:Uncharacterized protein n=1 Tax=Catharanthus roseus TaxID=4058 RepID=A0ACC0AHX4_CATRO|nr:hypothetical protein M9H77_28994 [Catharanthus roseus]
MSPTQFQFNDNQNTKRESNSFSSLKINKDSHLIKKSSPNSSSSSSSSTSSPSSLLNVVATKAAQPQPRHPVIIYTHSPKIIHTSPKDFMALVQKLTGFSSRSRSTSPEEIDHHQSSSNPQQQQQQSCPNPKPEPINYEFNDEINKNGNRNSMIDDNESTSVVTTDENNSSNSSCYVPSPPIFDHPSNPNNCFGNNGIPPFFNPNSADFLCSSTQPFYNYSESLFYMPNMRSSFSSSSLEGMKELPEF